MAIILMTLYITICFILIFIILIQSSKGAGIASLFGGGGGSGGAETNIFSGGGNNFITKLTIVLAIAFMSLAFIITLYISNQSSSGSGIEEFIEMDTAQQSTSNVLANATGEEAVDSEGDILNSLLNLSNNLSDSDK